MGSEMCIRDRGDILVIRVKYNVTPIISSEEVVLSSTYSLNNGFSGCFSGTAQYFKPFML